MSVIFPSSKPLAAPACSRPGRTPSQLRSSRHVAAYAGTERVYRLSSAPSPR